MTKRWIEALFLGMCFGTVVACGPAGEPSPAEPEIAGRVVDEGGFPLAGVTVELRPARGPETREMWPAAVLSGTTGEDGTFRLEAPGAGSWDVALAAPGRLSMYCRLRPLYEDAELPTVQLPPERRRTLRVRDAEGRPVAASVLAWGSRAGEAGPLAPIQCSPELRSVSVGPSGEVELSTAADESLVAVAWSDTGIAYGSIRRGAEALEIVLDGRFLEARLVTAEGRPLPDVQVVSAALPPLGTSGPEGEIRIPQFTTHGVPGASVFGAEGYLGTAEVDAVPKESGGGPVMLRLQDPAELEGRVVDAGTGRSVGRAWIAFGSEIYRPADANGQFRVSRSGPESSSLLRAVAPGYVPKTFDFQGEEPPKRLELERAASITGDVVDANGEPLAGAEVLAVPDGRSPRLRDEVPPLRLDLMPREVLARSDGDGRFRLDGLTPEVTYVLRVRQEGFAEERLLVSPSAEDATVVLSPGFDLAGRAVDGEGAPIVDAEALLIEEVDAQELRFRPRRLLTGADGELHFRDVRPGAYRLVVTALGSSPFYRSVARQSASGPVEDLGDLRLEPGVRLTGRVVDAAGTGLEGAWVGAAPVGAPPEAHLQAEFTHTDPDGRFVLEGVARGRVSVRVSLGGYVHQNRELPASEDTGPVDFVLAPTGR